MLRSLKLEHFTVFDDAHLEFSRGLNVVIGENGTGKSQLLKLAYALSAVSADAAKSTRQGKDELQRSIADKLVNTCRPDSLGRLVSRQRGRGRADVAVEFIEPGAGFAFSFSTNSKSEVKLEGEVPRSFLELPPIFIPTREMLSLFPGFASLYRNRETQFDDTYYDLALALEAPPLRGKRPKGTAELLGVLETAMGGNIALENGRFYLSLEGEGRGRFEMPLVAEGVRKLAMLTYLIVNGSLRENRSTLFWDEPETNLNPKLMRDLSHVLVALARTGVQVVLATHSLFLLRELSIGLGAGEGQHAGRFLALGKEEGGRVRVVDGASLVEVDPIAALEAELEQSDRFLALP